MMMDPFVLLLQTPINYTPFSSWARKLLELEFKVLVLSHCNSNASVSTVVQSVNINSLAPLLFIPFLVKTHLLFVMQSSPQIQQLKNYPNTIITVSYKEKMEFQWFMVSWIYVCVIFLNISYSQFIMSAMFIIQSGIFLFMFSNKILLLQKCFLLELNDENRTTIEWAMKR